MAVEAKWSFCFAVQYWLVFECAQCLTAIRTVNAKLTTDFGRLFYECFTWYAKSGP